MLSTLRWAGNAANVNSLADPNATFDPTLPCASWEEAAIDALVYADAPTKLIERLDKKPQRIGPDCLYENAESILRFYEEDIVGHVVKQEVKDKRVYKLLQKGEDDESKPADMARIAKSSYLGKDPFGDKPGSGEGLEPEQKSLLHSLQDRCHTYARVHCTREIRANVVEMEARHAKELAAGTSTKKRMPWSCYKACILMALPKATGLYELGLVLVMTRERGETPQQWTQRLDQGRTAVGRKLGGSNLSDSCYVELLLRGLLNKEKGELIKAEVLRQSKNPYYSGAKVYVEHEGKLYPATITRRHTSLAVYVDVEYEAAEGFSDTTEDFVHESRLTPDNNMNTHARAMESVRANDWSAMSTRISNDIDPQPLYTPPRKQDKRKLYTYQQALQLSQQPASKKRKFTRSKTEPPAKDAKQPEVNGGSKNQNTRKRQCEQRRDKNTGTSQKEPTEEELLK